MIISNYCGDKNHNQRNKKRMGFTIIEMLIVIGIMVASTPFILSQIKQSNDNKIAAEYADQTKVYTQSFTNAIKFNYATYYDYAVKNPNTTQVLRYSDIKTQGFLPSGNVAKLFNITPCVAMRYNPTTREMQSVMFYTDANNATTIKKLLVAKAVKLYGAGSGYYHSGNVTGSGASWSLVTGNNLVNDSVASRCDTGKLTDYGLAINLNLNDNFPKVTDSAQWLSRSKDDKSAQGVAENNNTMQTDIVMQSGTTRNGIYLEGNENTNHPVQLISNQSSKINPESYNTSKPSMIITGGFTADNIQPTDSVPSFTVCDHREVGAIAKQQADGKTPIVGQMQCTYNPLQCTGIDPTGIPLNGYCYLSATDIAIRYHPNISTFNCSVGYIDPTVPATSTADYSQKPVPYGSYCHRCDWLHCWDTWEANACDWQPSSNSISNINPKHGGGYTVYSGVQAVTVWSVVKIAGGDCGACGTGGTRNTFGVITSATCTTANPVIDSN